MSYTLELKDIKPVTHDTNHLIFKRPEGFTFEPGQATDFALDRMGWRDEKRPFTFTSLPHQDTLEFVIKSYPEHDGVTEQIAKMKPGDQAIIDDPWGAIEDEGTGTFIAGGAGITPFIAILRERLKQNGSLDGCKLIFSNSTEKDIILREEFENMPGLKTIFTVTDQDDAGVFTKKIDKEFLAEHIGQMDGHFYVCGPEPMIHDVVADLKSLGVSEDKIVIEDLD